MTLNCGTCLPFGGFLSSPFTSTPRPYLLPLLLSILLHPYRACLKAWSLYCLVQDLRMINKQSFLPTQYWLMLTLYSFQVPSLTSHLTVLDLTDTFSGVSFNLDSHDYLVFTWKEPGTGTASQFTLTVLPPRFWDNSHYFSQALNTDLLSLSFSRDA